jgi:hypothetical protein
MNQFYLGISEQNVHTLLSQQPSRLSIVGLSAALHCVFSYFLISLAAICFSYFLNPLGSHNSVCCRYLLSPSLSLNCIVYPGTGSRLPHIYYSDFRGCFHRLGDRRTVHGGHFLLLYDRNKLNDLWLSPTATEAFIPPIHLELCISRELERVAFLSHTVYNVFKMQACINQKHKSGSNASHKHMYRCGLAVHPS